MHSKEKIFNFANVTKITVDCDLLFFGVAFKVKYAGTESGPVTGLKKERNLNQIF